MKSCIRESEFTFPVFFLYLVSCILYLMLMIINRHTDLYMRAPISVGGEHVIQSRPPWELQSPLVENMWFSHVHQERISHRCKNAVAPPRTLFNHSRQEASDTRIYNNNHRNYFNDIMPDKNSTLTSLCASVVVDILISICLYFKQTLWTFAQSQPIAIMVC